MTIMFVVFFLQQIILQVHLTFELRIFIYVSSLFELLDISSELDF